MLPQTPSPAAVDVASAAGLPRTAPPPPNPIGPEEGGQRIFDVVVGSLLAVAAVPIVAIAWALVRLTSAGPGFYTQTRVGRFGRPFRILKLRTMYHACEAASGPKWSTRGDPRVTPVGRVLRKLHIDELPQLWNILAGDMSIVGPRPERPEFAGPLSRTLPGYANRLLVRPGLTGLAQVQLPPDSDIGSVRRKLVLDQWYVVGRSVWLDARLVAVTGLHVCGLSAELVRRLGRLPDPLAAAAADPLADTVIDGDHDRAGPPTGE
jgi:lipopolysaccharide/colanic/teichoic acid biosynthesis glycosyltransferase